MRDGKYVVLYVDDDADMLDTITVALQTSGFLVETAQTAEDGLRRFREATPDVIIVDLMMEEVDSGTSLVKELMVAGNKAPVYMLSSVGDQLNDTADQVSLGLSGIFQKPLRINALLRTLRVRLPDAAVQ